MNRPQPPSPLTEVLARERVPTATLARWGAELARILATAHATGTVHGDIRADAVSITADGTAHLDGFFVRPAARPSHPAPEFDHGGEPSPASDIYALGTVLRQAGGHADPALLQLCARMRHDDPAQRPTAAQVAEQLSGGHPPPTADRRPRARWVVVAAVTAVVVLASAGGWWLLAPGPTGLDAIGDPRTADPCALLDAPALQRFGPTQIYPDMASFVSCTVAIRPRPDEAAAVHATLEGVRDRGDRDLAPLPRQQAGDITIYHTRLGPGTCSRTVLLPTRSRVDFVASSSRKSGGLDPCAMVDTAVLHALPRLASGTLPRRTPGAPPNSLLWVDPCTLLDEAVLRSVPGLRADARQHRTAGTGCEWGEDDPALADPPLVSVYASRDSAVTGKSITLGSRRGGIRPSISQGPRIYCRVTLIQRSFPGGPDSVLHETLNVHVHLTVATAADRQCAVATDIAKAATARLPAPG
ncbi:hypothetical protein [Pseudonocardia acaciae]|uniref:hypothetical protein n=1 Tax=Pseudonocardia acaciae TaxID=551276 RepID=UPI00048AA7B0|nr:hypothetical protein [Pseudonocardia acaciae]